MLKLDISDFSPVIENKNLSPNKKADKNFNTQFHISLNMNSDKNKLFLSPKKQDSSVFSFINSGSNYNFLNSNDSSNNNNNGTYNNNNYNYGNNLININNAQTDKSLKTKNNNNISVLTSSNFDKTTFNNMKNLAAMGGKQINLNPNKNQQSELNGIEKKCLNAFL